MPVNLRGFVKEKPLIYGNIPGKMRTIRVFHTKNPLKLEIFQGTDDHNQRFSKTDYITGFFVCSSFDVSATGVSIPECISIVFNR